LADPNSISKLPVNTLADLSHVSNPTIVRFCRSVGYQGLTSFKLELTSGLNEGVPFIHRSVHSDDKTIDVLMKLMWNAVAAIMKYGDDAKSPALDSAVAAMMLAYAGKHQIVFVGLGNSGLVALDAQTKFFRLGVNTNAYTDGHLQVVATSILEPGDCVVAISSSGRTRELLDASDIARKNGATTIMIAPSNSPLANIGDIQLIADHTEDYDMYSPMVSRLLQLLIVDTLATCMALQIGTEKLRPILTKVKVNLRAKRFA
jgi:RpiR family carbohydrate utilization transcriptional regulator